MNKINFEHNTKTYEDLRKYILEGKNCCVVNPCGSGKSSIIASVIEEFADKGIVVITKQANAKDYYYEKCKAFADHNIPVLTYNMLHNLYKNDTLKDIRDIGICIFDEAHYIGANNWHNSVSELLNVTNAIAIGVTATPQRYMDQGTNRSIVDFFSGNSVGNYSTKDLQKQGVFIEPEYVITLASLDKEINKRIDKINNIDELSDAQKENYISRLTEIQSRWEEKECPRVIMSELLDKYMYAKKGNKILIFCKNVQSIATDKKYIGSILASIYPKKKIGMYEYTHLSDESVLHDFINDKSNYINVMFSVNKICETIHIPDLNILIFLRSSYSNRIITQQAGRINDINNPNKSLILDMVANLSKFGKVNNLNSIEEIDKQIQTEQSENETKVNINMSYMYGSMRLFNEIDNLAKRYQTYLYNNVQGTIAQLCHIFKKSNAKVKKLIEKGMDPIDALDSVPTKRTYTESALSEKIHNELMTINDPLTDYERSLVEKYYSNIKEIAINRNCTDEDMISNCALYLCKLAHNYASGSIHVNENVYFRNSIDNFLMRQLRVKEDRDSLFSETRIEELSYTDEYVLNSIYATALHDTLAEHIAIISNLSMCEEKNLIPKVALILCLRFGLTGCGCYSLEEIGELLHLTRNRIRQIEAKSIRQLRHPCAARQLEDYIDETSLPYVDVDKLNPKLQYVYDKTIELFGCDVSEFIKKSLSYKDPTKSQLNGKTNIVKPSKKKKEKQQNVEEQPLTQQLHYDKEFLNMLYIANNMADPEKPIRIITSSDVTNVNRATFKSTICDIINKKSKEPFWTYSILNKRFSHNSWSNPNIIKQLNQFEDIITNKKLMENFYKSLIGEDALHEYDIQVLTANGINVALDLITYSENELKEIILNRFEENIAKYMTKKVNGDVLDENENWILSNHKIIRSIMDNDIRIIQKWRNEALTELQRHDINVVIAA